MTLPIAEYKRRLVILYKRHDNLARPTTLEEAKLIISRAQELVDTLRAIEREIAREVSRLSPAKGLRGIVSSLMGNESASGDAELEAKLQAYNELQTTAATIRARIEDETLPDLRWEREKLALAEAEKQTAVNYKTYIRSAAWRQKAEAAKQAAGYRCQICNRSRDEVQLDAHHRTYERLGSEHPADITVLCRDCHQLFEDNKDSVTGTRTCKTCGKAFTPLFPAHEYCRDCYRAATSSATKNNGEEPTQGYCIRCRETIALNPQAPYCKKCYRVWKRYKNPAYEEGYCHVCGEKHASSMVKPACYGCYKTHRDRLAFSSD